MGKKPGLNLCLVMVKKMKMMKVLVNDHYDELRVMMVRIACLNFAGVEGKYVSNLYSV